LGIEWIGAHSPQAKGRVERCFGTRQDRLVKGLRVAGASTLEQANDYLQGEFLPDWEKRFTVKARKATDAHRQLGREHKLEAILSQVESRVVANDYTLRFRGQSYQVARDSIRAGLRGATVRVEQRLDGTLAVRFRDRYLTTARCDVKAEALPVSGPAPVKTSAKAKPRSRWMEGFDLRGSPPLWKTLAQESWPGHDPRRPGRNVFGANLSRPTGSFGQRQKQRQRQTPEAKKRERSKTKAEPSTWLRTGTFYLALTQVRRTQVRRTRAGARNMKP
jgi:hypothetical protein